MGQSNSVPDYTYDEDELDVDEEEELKDNYNDKDPEFIEDGFNVVFTPELIQRIQAHKNKEENTSPLPTSSDLTNNNNRVQQVEEGSLTSPSSINPLQVCEKDMMEKQENQSIEALEKTLDSLPTDILEDSKYQLRCSEEEAACTKCIEKFGLSLDCQKLIEEFNKCAMEKRS